MTQPSHDAFRATASGRLDVPGDELSITPRPDAELAVPGFATLVARHGDDEVRGWARDDGTVVVFQETDFDALFDALGFATDPPPVDDEHLARLVVWGYGPRYSLRHQVDRGELGMPEDLRCPPVRTRRGGAVTFKIVVHDHNPDDPCILSLEFSRQGGEYEFGTRQLAPPASTYYDE